MWNSWIDKANEVGRRAQEAAANIGGQLNESVGGTKLATANTNTITSDDRLKKDYLEDDNDDDAFFDDENDGFYNHDSLESTTKNSTITNNENGWEEDDDIEVEDLEDDEEQYEDNPTEREILHPKREDEMSRANNKTSIRQEEV